MLVCVWRPFLKKGHHELSHIYVLPFFSLFCYEDTDFVDSNPNKQLLNSPKDKEPLKESNESSNVSTKDVIVTSALLPDPERSAIDPNELLSDADPLNTDSTSSAFVTVEGSLELENSVDVKNNDTSAINICSSNDVDDDLFGGDMMVDQHGDQNMEKDVDDESFIKNINNGNHSSDISNVRDDIHNGGCDENTTSVEKDTESIRDRIGGIVDTNNDDADDNDVGEIRKDSNRKESEESNTSVSIENTSSGLETLSEEDKILLEIDSLNMKREDLL